MKTETEIIRRLDVLEPWYEAAESGSFRESMLKSAIDELEWVLKY